MDSLCEQFEYSSLKPNLSYNFKKDLNIIIKQLNISNKINIIDICLDCDDLLSWNSNNFINLLDYNWLISHGYNYINKKVNNKLNIESFNELIELFRLQLE